MKNIEHALTGMGLLIILFVGVWTDYAFAQDEEVVLEEVIVTAQKREQSAQDVPIAISAFDEQFLIESGVGDMLELQAFAPGLSIYNEYSHTVPSFNIRGLGTTSTNLALESSVGIYVDGVYRSRQTSGLSDLLDVARVEVLKGPQGTLFGKNTVAGAVQFLTMAPDLNELGGFAELRAGSEDLRKFSGAVNIPLVEGRAAARISAGITNRDGYVDNILLGTELNEKDRYTIRGQLLFRVTDTLTARLIVDHSEVDEKCCGGSNVFDGPTDTIAGFNPAAGLVFPVEAIAGRSGVLSDDFYDREVAWDHDSVVDVEESGLSLELAWDLEKMTFTSLTSHRSYEHRDTVGDWMPADFILVDIEAEQDTFTQEFRIDGTWGDRVTYTAGLYYFDQELESSSSLIFGQDANTLLFGGATLGNLDALGFFGPPGVVCSGAAFPGAGVEDLCPSPVFPAGEGRIDLARIFHE